MMVLCYIAVEQRAASWLMVPYVPGANELMVVAGAMAGACLGFLWFNCNPASVFMGDTGSLSLADCSRSSPLRSVRKCCSS
jgi:phospho-N-acetylmuramoyl-pentapeptide-transferase